MKNVQSYYIQSTRIVIVLYVNLYAYLVTFKQLPESSNFFLVYNFILMLFIQMLNFLFMLISLEEILK
jgi:hypothetical protein